MQDYLKARLSFVKCMRTFIFEDVFYTSQKKKMEDTYEKLSKEERLIAPPLLTKRSALNSGFMRVLRVTDKYDKLKNEKIFNRSQTSYLSARMNFDIIQEILQSKDDITLRSGVSRVQYYKQSYKNMQEAYSVLTDEEKDQVPPCSIRRFSHS